MPEFNPVNEVLKKQYEEALLHGKCRDPKTVKSVWGHINTFEKFTSFKNFKTFDKEQAQHFKSWLERQKNKKGELLSLSTVKSTLANVRDFFEWLAMHPQYIRKIDARAISYLHLSNNANRAARASREKPPASIAELEMALNAMPHNTDIEKRDRAIFAFTILTCVRDDALISIKRKDVDAKEKTLWQDPKHVNTKNRKGIVTRFVAKPIALAETIVLEWIDYVDNDLQFKLNDPLFPKTLVKNDLNTMAFAPAGLSRKHWAKTQVVRDIFKRAFTAVNLPYYNPHSFRNTICKWGAEHLTQYEFKALSQNLGHEHAMTTYNSYAKLSQDEQIDAIAKIGTINTDLKTVHTDDLMAEVARRMGK